MPLRNNIMLQNSAPIAATPPASPSMLSSRLKALVMATIQKAVMSMSMYRIPTTNQRIPMITAATATSTCKLSFIKGRRLVISSKSPIRPIAKAMKKPFTTGAETSRTIPSANNNAIAAREDSMMAIPPNLLIESSRHLS